MAQEPIQPVIATHIVCLPETAFWRAMAAEIAIDTGGSPQRVILKDAKGEVVRDLPAKEITRLACLPPDAVFLLTLRPEDGFMSEQMVTDVEMRVAAYVSNRPAVRLSVIMAWRGKTLVLEHFAEG